MRCECGSVSLPKGSDISIVFYEGGNSSSMTLAHTVPAMVTDEKRLITYGIAPASPSLTPDRIFIKFPSLDSLFINSVIQVKFTIGATTIASRYIGVKHDYWQIPKVSGVPTISLSCGSVFGGMDISGKTIRVEFISICDLSNGDCCQDTPPNIVLVSHVKRSCASKATTTLPPADIRRYTLDCANGLCYEDENGDYTSLPYCYEFIRDCPTTTTTTTTLAPATTSPPPTSTTTTTAAP